MPIGKTLTGCVAAVFLLAAPFDARSDHLSEYDYIILHGDELIGSYRVNVTRNANEIEIEAESDLKVRFGPLTVFEFEHKRRELWRDSELVESVARTTKNGESYDIKITRHAEGYKRVVNGREDRLEDPVKILALWHGDLFEHEFFISPLEDKLYWLSVNFVGDGLRDALDPRSVHDA